MGQLNRKNDTNREKLIKTIETFLGGALVDVELDKNSYDEIIDSALSYYRQRSENSVEESYLFMTFERGKNDYELPNEVIEVRKILRRGFGLTSNNSENGQFDPFDLAFTNMYVLTDPSLGGLATYDFYAQNMEVAGRLFGYEINYSWNEATKRLKIVRNLRAHSEEVALWIYNYKPEEELLNDTYAYPWIRKYALAEAKMVLGQAYEKFASLPGPNGSVSLNGAQLKSEAVQEKADLEDQLRKYADGGRPLGFIMG